VEMNLRIRKCDFQGIKGFFSIIFFVSLVLFLSVPNGWSAAPISGEALPGLDGFNEAMLNLIDKYDIPGASLAVSFKGKLILARGYGYAKKSLTEKIPVQPQSRFRFASLSKPLTAAAIMLLVEEGKLSLDDSIISLLQELGPQKITDSRINQITVQHLLEHRGGFDRSIGGDPMLLNQPPCPRNIKSFLARKLDFTPGEKHFTPILDIVF
jgi:CubicO group peptidase (beta-lactamase class C family)